ncbi:MAG: hypothetical protein WCR33_03315, partial [Bacilli bacterium]
MKISRKIFISMIAVIFAVIALGASTFAWFNLTTTNTINDVSMSVRTEYGLEVSFDNVNWKSSLKDTDFDFWTDGQKLDSVTSTDGKTFTDKSEIDVTGGSTYVHFALYFRAEYITDNMLTNGHVGVYLVDKISGADVTDAVTDGTGITSTGVSWSPDVPFEYSDGVNYDLSTPEATYYAASAARLSTESFGWDAVAHDGSSSVGVPSVFDLSDATSVSRGYGYTYGAFAYYNAKMDNSLNDIGSTGPSTITTLSTINATTVIANDNTSLICTLVEDDGMYYGKVNIALWLEGWDGDCFDAVF